MNQGKIKFYNAEKGYGFIQPDCGGGDIFLHRTALETAQIRNLDAGQAITYDVIADQKNGKSKAVNIALA